MPVNNRSAINNLQYALLFIALSIFPLKANVLADTGNASPTFDGEAAFSHLRVQCEFGPRVPNSKAHDQTKDYFKQKLAAWSDEVQEQSFATLVNGKRVDLTNIIAYIRPLSGTKKWVMVCAHWDSRPIADMEQNPLLRNKPIPGANDGASGAAVVLELARVLSASRPKCGVILVLFDGEDYGEETNEMFLGSRYFAKKYQGPKPDWAVLLDMVGDRDLQISKEGYSRKYAGKTVDYIWQSAKEVGSKAFVDKNGLYIMDDQLPLIAAGIPCIDVIDINYPYWHTLADTPDKCSPVSLQAVGSVLVKAIKGYN